jgi:hypothetical protein
MKNSTIARVLWILSVVCIFALPDVSRAVPYASGISESGGTVTFYLNEDAQSVKVVRTGQSTLDLGALNRGSHNFNLDGATAYEIQVTKSAAPAWVQVSQDTNPLVQFYSPRSVAVNTNPASPYFGRIYVLEHAVGPNPGTTGTGRTVTKGIFALNADRSDALGQGDFGLTGGLESFSSDGANFIFGGNNAYEPWKIFVGEDDYVYVSDAQDPRGSLSRVDANLASGELVLPGVGNASRADLHTVVYGINVTGSLADGNLSVLGIDGQWSAGNNSVLRWDMGAGPLPSENPPTMLFNAGLSGFEQDSDIDVAPNGNIFVLFHRATVSATGPGVQVFDSAGAQLWGSISGGVDSFLGVRSLKVSPDGKKLAVYRDDQRTVIIALTNGVPDMSNTNVVDTFVSTSTQSCRAVTWDLAGNLYVASNNRELLRVWSPGGTTTAITKSDGTFNITVPQTTVSITNSIKEVSENSGTAIVFTLNRTGNTAVPLTANLLVSGTASNGVDYLPAIPSSITFAGGATSTNITVTPANNTKAEFTKTLNILLGGSTDYSAGTPSSANVTILDDESPEISVALVGAEDRLLEGYSHAKLDFQVTRKGLLTATPAVNLSYSGQAALGSKFNGPSSVAFAANAVTANFSITPINNQSFEGDQSVIAGIAAGSGYTIGISNTATATIIDDEVAPGTTLFSDDFSTPGSDASPNWIINSQDFFLETHADFGFDYTTLGVPALPGGSDTLGLRLRANENTPGAPVIDISLSPLGLDLGTSDYRLTFNMWINYNGPMFNGGSGSTYHLDAGVGTTADHPNWQNWFGADGVWFSVDGDGGAGGTSSADIAAYFGGTTFSADSGVYAAGIDATAKYTTDPFYSLWGGIPAPDTQIALYPANQTGISQAGNMGASWHSVVVTKVTNIVTWAIDGITIATVTNDPASLSTNVFIGYHDEFAGSSGTPAMSFAIVDNLKVMTYSDAPPTTPSAANITRIAVSGGNVQINFTGAITDDASAFTIQSSQTVNGTYSNTAATITGGAGSFQASLPVNGTTRFYRIKR